MAGCIKTVGDLITALQGFAPDTPVVVPGFDEAGYADIYELVIKKIAAVNGNHCFEYDDEASGFTAVCIR
jgi:hypothetical protein